MTTTTPVDGSTAPAARSDARDEESSAPGRPPAPDENRSIISRFQGRLIRLAPKAIVRRLAGPYIAGETRQDALALVERLHSLKVVHITGDLPCEAVTGAPRERV